MRQVSQERMVDLSLDVTTYFRDAAFVADRYGSDEGDGGSGGEVGGDDDSGIKRATAAENGELET